MDEKEYQALLKCSGEKRYKYFIKKVVDYEEVWGLYDDGWAMTASDDGEMMIPLWPKKEFAEACALDEWKNYRAEKIELEEFIEQWIPTMKEEGYLPSIFWNNIDSVVVKVDTLRAHLEEELENY